MPATPPPTTIFPTEERFVNVVREATNGTIPAAPYGVTIPLPQFDPEDKPIWLLDSSLRGAMGDIYDFLQGPMYADVTIPEAPVYVDTFPHALYNTLGDYTQNVQGTSTTSNTTTLNGALTVGATTVVLTSGTGYAANQWVLIYVSGTTGPSEIVQVASVASNTLTLMAATPIRFPHNNGAQVQTTSVTTGTYQHIFTGLNSGFLGATNYQNFGQPPTHTFTDRTQVPTNVNPGFARQYAYSCFHTLTMTGNAEKLLAWNGGFSSYPGQIAATLPTASVSTVRAFPDFNCTFQLATSGVLAPVYDIVEWQVTLTRKLKVQFTNDSIQNPYVIGRGGWGVTGKLMFAPATDETALLYMLNNTQPQLELLVTNNLATSSPLYQALQLDILFCDFETSKINAADALFGYDVGFKAHHTANTRNSVTTTGWSGGYSALKATVSNAVPIF